MDRKAIAGLLNPVRIQIVLYLLGHSVATTKDVAKALPDVPAATLYRHIKRLQTDGILRVCNTTQIRGAVEKEYELVANPFEQIEKSAQTGDPDDLLMLFYQFVMTILLEFSSYVATGAQNLEADLVGFRTYPVYLSDEEAKDFVDDFSAVLQKHFAKTGGEGRKRRSFSFVFMPARDSTLDPPEGET